MSFVIIVVALLLLLLLMSPKLAQMLHTRANVCEMVKRCHQMPRSKIGVRDSWTVLRLFPFFWTKIALAAQ